MLSNSIVVATSLLSTAIAIALPATNVGGNPDNCSTMDGDQCYEVDVGYYSDSACTEEINHNCAYATYCGTAQSGDYSCQSGDLPAAPFYAQTKDSANPNVQIVFTEDKTCPPSGPGAVFATLINNDACVEINLGGSVPGISIFPDGGAALSKRGNMTYLENDNYAHQKRSKDLLISRNTLQKRDAKCSGFTVDSQEPSESQSVQVSSIVDCTNGNDAGCTITETDETSQSVTTSYSATAGGGIEGIFEASVTFGMDYTDESSTSLQEGFTIAQGQKGYLSAYSSATLFTGTFTGCDSGDAEQPGTTLAIKVDGFTYLVVNTGA